MGFPEAESNRAPPTDAVPRKSDRRGTKRASTEAVAFFPNRCRSWFRGANPEVQGGDAPGLLRDWPTRFGPGGRYDPARDDRPRRGKPRSRPALNPGGRSTGTSSPSRTPAPVPRPEAPGDQPGVLRCETRAKRYPACFVGQLRSGLKLTQPSKDVSSYGLPSFFAGRGS